MKDRPYLFPTLPLPIDLGHLRHEVANFIAIESGYSRYAVDALDEVLGCFGKHHGRRLAIATTEQVAVRRDDHFDLSSCRPVLVEQAAEVRLKMVADLDPAQFFGAGPA